MKREYDFSKAKRGPVVKVPKGKTRITIRPVAAEAASAPALPLKRAFGVPGVRPSLVSLPLLCSGGVV